MEIPTGDGGGALAAQSSEQPPSVTGITCTERDSLFDVCVCVLAVRLVLEGGEKVLEVTCALGASVESVRERMCEEWGLTPATTTLSYNGVLNLLKILKNNHSLSLSL